MQYRMLKYIGINVIIPHHIQSSRFIVGLTNTCHLWWGTFTHLPEGVTFMATAGSPLPRDRHYCGRFWSLLRNRTVEVSRVLAALFLGLKNGVSGSFVFVWVAESGFQFYSAMVPSVRSRPWFIPPSSNRCRRRALHWCLASAHPRLVCNSFYCDFSEKLSCYALI